MESMEARVVKMETQLKQWAVKLDELMAKAKAAGAEVKADYHKSIDDLQAKHQAAHVKLNEFRAADHAKWESLKAGIETVWSDLEGAFKNLKN